MTDKKRVGLVVGREWSWPPAFIEAVRRRDAGVMAEMVQMDVLHAGAAIPYDVLIDRLSHEVPFLRSAMKAAAAQGVAVINNPFLWTAGDTLLAATLAQQLGVAHPRTVALPNHRNAPGVVSADLANLEFPLDWQAALDYVGLPAIVKDARGRRGEVQRVDSLDELLRAYRQTGGRTMVLQELVEWDHYLRCMCIGQEYVLPMTYDPAEGRYPREHAHLSDTVGAQAAGWAQVISRALGFDLNAVDFAVRDGVPYAIDILNPAPDMDFYALSPHYFGWVVDAMADLAIERALVPCPSVALCWKTLLAGDPND